MSQPRTFTMDLTPHRDAVLVFDATDADESGEYTIYSIRPEESERFWRGEWDAMKKSLQPTGRVSVADVVRDDDKRETRILAYGIERFATSA